MLLLIDLEGASVHLWYIVCFKNSLYDFVSALFVQIFFFFLSPFNWLSYMFFNVNMKNLAFDTPKMHGFL